MKDSKKEQKMNQALIELIDERIASYIHEHADEIRAFLGESKSSISDEDYWALQKKCQGWQSKYEDIQKRLQQQCQEWQSKCDKFKNQLQGKNDELQHANEKLSALEAQVEPYQQLESAYQKYLCLPEMLRVQLQGIFGQGRTALAFYKEVVQPKRIKSFYDYLAQRMNNMQDDENLSILKELLDFCIDETSYERIPIEIGTAFDSQQMQLAAGSLQLGTVKRVLLDGYRQPGAEMPVRKSIVCIGDR